MKNIYNLKIEGFPQGVTTKVANDERGQSYYFEHITFGSLGTLVIINMEEGKQELKYDFFEGNSNQSMRLGVFNRIIYITNEAFNEAEKY